MSQQHAQSRATPLEHQPSVSRSRQQGQSVVEDVVIPEHLLRMASVRRSWNLDHRGSSTYAADGPVQNIAQAQTQRLRPNLFRAASTGWYNRTTRAQPQRRPSQPTTRREVTSLSSTSSHESFRPKPQPATHRPESVETSRSSLYDQLNNYSFHGSSSESSASYDDEKDPAAPEFGSDAARVQTQATQAEGSDGLQRRGTITRVVTAVIPAAVQQTAQEVVQNVRRSSMYDVYEKAKQRGTELQRKQWVQYLFEYAFYTFLIIFIYLVLVGLPLWKGAVYWLWWVVQNKFVIEGGYAITIGLAALYAFSPLLVLFEKDPPMPNHPEGYDLMQTPGVANTALLIPCYKSAGLIAKTLEAAVKIFPPQNIFVIANGNSPTPLDNTEEVCRPYGVNHVWSPVGSKIVAQFVGAYAAKGFKDVLLIDDDCALPPNFPIVSDRLTGKVQCIGYTIKSVGPESSKGTFCQQAQDLEYKISGLQRALAGKIGSATFPHGAISLWDREFLIKTFHDHPGFSVSEDWFFGHSCRRLGGRIKMCTSVFVETETPPAVFFSSGGSRGGFGEMTIFKQRFMRWNFFFVNGMWYDMAYILTSWNLGWWEIGAKLFVFQEVYETLLYLLTPFVLPISFIVRPSFCGYLLASTVVLYLINVVIFNEVHLRLKKERVAWSVLIFYYMPYKIVLTFINVASCYWSLYKYARYFAKRHPKVIEDEKAVEVVLRLEERPEQQKQQQQQSTELGRRLTVTAVGTRLNNDPNCTTGLQPVAAAAGVEEFDFAEKRKTSMARSMV